MHSIWDAFRQHGGSPIPPPLPADGNNLSAEQRDLLNDVWNTYGQFSAWKLRNMTHDEPPWQNAYRLGRNALIKNEELSRYFKTQVTDGEAE